MYSKAVPSARGKVKKEEQIQIKQVVTRTPRSTRVVGTSRPQTPAGRVNTVHRSRSSPSLTSETCSADKSSSKVKSGGMKISVIFPKSDKGISTPRLYTPHHNPCSASTPKRNRNQSFLKRSHSESHLNVVSSDVDVSHSVSNPNEETSNLTVAVRVRPFNAEEWNDPSVSQAVAVHESTVEVNESDTVHSFTYDHCLWSCDQKHESYSNQEVIFTTLAQPLLDRVFEGYNACLFAYGQTGSGKSYSMMGPHAFSSDDNISEESGIIPRFCYQLFQRVASLEASGKSKPKVEVSYFQIYNEKIHDLLKSSEDGGIGPALKVREHPTLGPYVVDLSVHEVKSFEDMKYWLSVGRVQKVTAATGMNQNSSRSHSIFTITLSQAHLEVVMGEKQGHSWQAKVNLIDLAGSERLANTCASGDRLREGVSINRSLLILGKVITALSENDGSSKKKKFIPYRESVLTWLLKESLGGNSRTTMLATISPASAHVEETLATLRYACQARSIVNRVRVNEAPHEQLIRALSKEVAELRAFRQEHASKPVAARKLLHTEEEIDKRDLEINSLKQQLLEAEENLKLINTMWEKRLEETREEVLKAEVAKSEAVEAAKVAREAAAEAKKIAAAESAKCASAEAARNSAVEIARAATAEAARATAAESQKSTDLEAEREAVLEMKRVAALDAEKAAKLTAENTEKLAFSVTKSHDVTEEQPKKQQHIKVDDYHMYLTDEFQKPCLLNLTTDGVCNNILLYFLPEKSIHIGKETVDSKVDIHLTGRNLKEEFCEIKNEDNILTLIPHIEQNIYLNNQRVTTSTPLQHGDILAFDESHVFKVIATNCRNSNFSNFQNMLPYKELEDAKKQIETLEQALDTERNAFETILKKEKKVLEEQLQSEILALKQKLKSDTTAYDKEIKKLQYQIEQQKTMMETVQKERVEQVKEKLELEKQLKKYKRLELLSNYDMSKVYQPYKSDFLHRLKKVCSLSESVESPKFRSNSVLGSPHHLAELYKKVDTGVTDSPRHLAALYKKDREISSSPRRTGRKTPGHLDYSEVKPPSSKRFKSMSADEPGPDDTIDKVNITKDATYTTRKDNVTPSGPVTPNIPVYNNYMVANTGTPSQSHSYEDVRLYVKEANQRCKVLGLTLEFELDWIPGKLTCDFVKVQNDKIHQKWKITHFLDWLIRLRHHRLDKSLDDLLSESMWEDENNTENQQNAANIQKNVKSLINQFSYKLPTFEEKNSLFKKQSCKNSNVIADSIVENTSVSKNSSDKIDVQIGNKNGNEDNVLLHTKDVASQKSNSINSMNLHNSHKNLEILNSFRDHTSRKLEFQYDQNMDADVMDDSHDVLCSFDENCKEDHNEHVSYEDDYNSDNAQCSESFDSVLNKSMACSSLESSDEQEPEYENSSPSSTESFHDDEEEEIEKYIQLLEESYIGLKKLCPEEEKNKVVLDMLEKSMEKLRNLYPTGEYYLNSPLRKYSPPRDLSITPAKSSLRSPATGIRTPKSVSFNLPYPIEESPAHVQMSPMC